MADSNNPQLNFEQTLPQLTEFSNQLRSLTDTLRTFQNVVNNITAGQERFRENTKKSTSTIANLRNTSRDTAGSMRQLSEQSRQLQNNMLNFNRQVTGTIGVFQKLHSWINNVRFGFQGLLLALGGRQLWDFLIGTNQRIETLQQSMEVTLQSSARAEEAIRRLRSYAALTPYDELEVYQAGEMLASNRMEVDRWIRVAGDLASAKRSAGVQLLDVVRVLTRINSGDFGKAMIRLRQMGISLQDLKAKGLEFTKSSTFLGTADDMLGALESIIEERYGGLTLALGKTMEGLISTIKDYFLQFGIEMGQESFDELKDFLTSFKDQLQEFRESETFKEIIIGFNYLKDEIVDGLQPWIATLKALFSFILKNLPLIGTMIKTYFYYQFANTIVSLLQKTVGFIINMTHNWALVSKSTIMQNNLLAEQNVHLGTQLTLLAKINAMRALGNKYATEQVAAEASATAMIQAGVFRKKSGQIANIFAGAGGAAAAGTAAAGTAAAGTAAAGTAVTGGGFLATVSAALPLILGAVGIIVALGAAIKGVIAILTPNEYDLKRTTQDYERIIGAEAEEIKTLEALNSQRQYNSDQVKYYSDLVNRHAEQVDKLTKELQTQNQAYKQGKSTEEAVIQTKKQLQQAEENLRKSRNALSSSTAELARRNEQILEIAPELSQKLIDENGRIDANTSAFERNTQAIQANIDARKRQLSKTFKEQMDVAQTEIKRAKKEIENIQDTILLVQRHRDNALTGNPFFRKLVGISSKVRGFFVQDDLQKQVDESLRILKYDDEGRDLAISDLIHEQYELQEKIDELQQLLKEPEEMIKKGYYLKDEEGNAILDAEGNYEYDVPRWERDQARYEAERVRDLRTGDIDASDLEERLQSTKSDIDKIRNEYQVKLNQLILDGFEKDSTEYIQVEQAMYKEIANYWEEKHEDLKVLKTQFDDSVNKFLEQVPEELRQMLIDGIGIDQMIDAVETIREVGLFAIDAEMKKYAKALQKIADSDITNLEVYTADFETYATKMNISEKFKAIENEILKELTDALVNSVKLGKDSKKDILNEFNRKWEIRKRMLETERDIVLTQDELAGREKGSSIYDRHFKEMTLRIRELIFAQMNELRDLIPSLEGEDKYKAQLQLLTLQKEANELLLAIKENTSKIGEFNRPQSVKAITWYDYKTEGQPIKGLEIGNADIAITVEGPLTLEEVEQTLEAISDTFQKKYGKNIKRIQNAGIKNPKITGI
jgi:DNA repair exonuclease SbcCD ATPase subunit